MKLCECTVEQADVTTFAEAARGARVMICTGCGVQYWEPYDEEPAFDEPHLCAPSCKNASVQSS